MKRLIFLSVVSFCFFGSTYTYAQSMGVDEAGFEYATDALRFSQTQPTGSTRIQTLGGAQTALGGDISNGVGNPAGLGFFNKSEFTFTPTISFNGSNSRFLNSTTGNTYGNLNFNNLGIVFSKAKDAVTAGKWRGGSFSISFNTTSQYNSRFKYSGLNDTTSITDSFVELANGIYPETLLGEKNGNDEYFYWESLAYRTGLIDTLWGHPSDNQYFGYNELESVTQQETVTTRGSQSQWNFAYGGNYNDRLYFGATLGLANFRHIEERSYREVVETDNDGFDDLSHFNINDRLTTKGSGINLGLGMIFRVSDFLRLGASVQTPTYYYYVQSQYDGDITTYFNVPPPDLGNSETGRLETTVNKYKFSTPWKLSGGAAFFFNKRGFITVDLDYLPYNRMKLYALDDFLSFYQTNQEIRTVFKPAFNFRLGGEMRVSIFRLRAGYALQGFTFEGDNSPSNPIHYASLGAGMRKSNMYLDLGLVQSFLPAFYYRPYVLPDNTHPEAKVTSSRIKTMVTLGFFF